MKYAYQSERLQHSGNGIRPNIDSYYLVSYKSYNYGTDSAVKYTGINQQELHQS